MKKKLFFIASILFLFLCTFTSCGNQITPENKALVSFSIPAEVFKTVAARAADSSEDSDFNIEVSLVKNGDKNNPEVKIKTLTNIPAEGTTFEFTNIPVGTKVQALVRLTHGSVTLTGASLEKTLDSESLTLSVKLTQTGITPEGDEVSIKIKFKFKVLLEGKESGSTNTDDYKLDPSLEITDNLSGDLFSDEDEISSHGEKLLASKLIEMYTKGYLVRDNIDPEVDFDLENSTVTMTFYCEKKTIEIIATSEDKFWFIGYDDESYIVRSEEYGLYAVGDYTLNGSELSYLEYAYYNADKDELKKVEIPSNLDALLALYKNASIENGNFTYTSGTSKAIKFTVKTDDAGDEEQENTYTGGGVVTIDNGAFNLKLADDTALYIDGGCVMFFAQNKSGEILTGENEFTDWEVKLFFGGNEVAVVPNSGPGCWDNTWFQFNYGDDDNPVNLIPGNYQMYVSAKHNGVRSSSTFDVTVQNTYKPESLLMSLYTDSASFKESIANTISSLTHNLTIELRGTGTATTIADIFEAAKKGETDYSSAHNGASLPYKVTYDLSKLEGRTVISAMGDETACYSSAPIYKESCIQKLILPDCIETIGSSAFMDYDETDTPDSDYEPYLTLVIGKDMASITIPYQGCKSPFKKFEVSSANPNLTTNSAGSVIIENSSHTILWGANTTELFIPDNITTIGKGAFYGCIELSSTQTLHEFNNVERIYEYAFGKTGANYNLTEKVKAIGIAAFDADANVAVPTADENHPDNWEYTSDLDVWSGNKSGIWSSLDNMNNFITKLQTNYLRRKN